MPAKNTQSVSASVHTGKYHFKSHKLVCYADLCVWFKRAYVYMFYPSILIKVPFPLSKRIECYSGRRFDNDLGGDRTRKIKNKTIHTNAMRSILILVADIITPHAIQQKFYSRAILFHSTLWWNIANYRVLPVLRETIILSWYLINTYRYPTVAINVTVIFGYRWREFI